ncbi:nucleotide disphospho-sugar-binding domain-containing protein [Streptomyces sp. NPDC087787]|uniref:nucleotide disphospho-sugar-binding domain-containing protein n=1 Tax=Streptomyces sp. NPDC087787 TaxID=3365803 RepID=UPI0037FF575A
MRVLIAASPGIGHIFPAVPLAWALRLAGHEVLVATGGDGLAVREAGLPVADVCPGLTLVDIVKTTVVRHPAMFAEFSTARFTDFADSLPYYAQMMNDQPAMMDRYVQVAEKWQPDLIVYSALTVGGLVGAAKLGIPAVEHGYGFFRTEGYGRRLRELNAEVFDRHGVDLPERMQSIDIAPPSLVGEVSSGWPMRYLPYNGGSHVPDWLLEEPRRPRIAVTLGTTAPGLGGLDRVNRIIELAGDIDAEFVLALGNTDTSALGPVPGNVRIEGWVPLNLLLPSSVGIIHHGGSGTTLAALDAGVPQILLPDGSDRHVNADAVAARGAGLSAHIDDVTKDSVDALLHDDALRVTAAEVRDEMHGMPDPRQLIARLEAII